MIKKVQENLTLLEPLKIIPFKEIFMNKNDAIFFT